MSSQPKANNLIPGPCAKPPLLPFQCLRLTAVVLLRRLQCQEDLSFKLSGLPSAGTIGGPSEEGGPSQTPLPPPSDPPPPPATLCHSLSILRPIFHWLLTIGTKFSPHDISRFQNLVRTKIPPPHPPRSSQTGQVIQGLR